MKMRLDKTWSGNVLTVVFQNYDAEGNKAGVAAEPLTFDRTTADPTMRDHAEMHGWEHRFGDAAAILKDKKSGKSATVEEKRAAIEQLTKYYAGGATSWNLKGVAKVVDEDALLAQLLAKKGLKAVAIEPSEPVDVTAAMNGEIAE